MRIGFRDVILRGKQRKTVLITAGTAFVLAVCAGAVALLGTVPLSCGWVDGKTLAWLRMLGADSCATGTVRVTAWRGVSISALYLRGALDSVHSYTLHCDEVAIPGNVIRYCGKRRIVGKRVTAEMNAEKNGSGMTLERAAGIALFLDSLFGGRGALAVTGCDVAVLERGNISVSGGGGTIMLQSEAGRGIGGKCAFENAIVFGDSIHGVDAGILLTPERKLLLEEGKGTYYRGPVRAEAAVSLAGPVLDTFSMIVDSMDFDRWYHVRTGTEELKGNATLYLNGGPANLPVTAKLVIRRCTVDGLPLQVALASLLGLKDCAALRFSEVAVDAVFGRDDTIAVSASGTGEQLVFSTDGHVMRDGRLQLDLRGTFPKTVADTFAPFVRKMLIPAKEGGREFYCRVYGTYMRPKFELDRTMLQRAVGSLFEEIRDDVMKYY